MLCGLNHLGGQNTSSAVQGGEGLVQLSHLAADGGLGLHDIYGEAGVSDIQSGLDTGDTAADHQGALGNGGFTGSQGRVQAYLGNSGAAEDDGLFGADLHVLMYPGALLTDVGDLYHVGVQTGGLSGLAEGGLVHTGGAGADNDTGELMLTDRFGDQILTCLRAHILIFGGYNHAGLIAKRFGNGLHIHCAGDVGTAMAHEYSNSLHCDFLSYLAYLRSALTMAC